jgi:prepilin-type N-terminal cleavage/methylation domain-containing protein
VIVAQLFKLRSKTAQVKNLRHCSAFTVIELMVVIAIIAALAALILGTASYAQKRSARSRAESEIAAIAAALESYKADNGGYPKGNADPANTSPPYDTDALYANNDPEGGDPTTAKFINSAKSLYRALSGDSDGNPTTSATTDTKNYLSSALTPKMLRPNPAGPNTYLVDPYGNAYGYSLAYSVNPPNGYNPTYDLWSTCGETSKKLNGETFQQYQQRWIRNW